MKIAVGLSGGVDSSLSAHLLVEAGHDVVGVYLECWRAPGCRAEDDRKDALAVALELGIQFQVLDFRAAYRDRVVERFFADYRAGLTPNPDVWCNVEIKFGLFYDWAMENGFDAVATGHYARILRARPDDTPPLEGLTRVWPSRLRAAAGLALCIPTDTHKDQTYFLYRLRQEQLAHIVFPLAGFTKDQVRAAARERRLAVAAKPDSQGICFIGDINVRDFLREHLGEQPGQVLDTDGNVVGEHPGHWFFTIGQRHGFTLYPKVHTKHQEWKHVLPPLYVIQKNAYTNTIIVGYGIETLHQSFALVEDTWRQLPDEAAPYLVRLRHGGALLPATVKQRGSIWHIQLQEPQRGIAAGQAAVIYGGSGVCLGGGLIAQ